MNLKYHSKELIQKNLIKMIPQKDTKLKKNLINSTNLNPLFFPFLNNSRIFKMPILLYHFQELLTWRLKNQQNLSKETYLILSVQMTDLTLSLLVLLNIQINIFFFWSNFLFSSIDKEEQRNILNRVNQHFNVRYKIFFR